MNVDKLEGRELDAAVAEARGWEKRIVSNQPFSDAVFTFYDGPDRSICLEREDGPPYHIAAAWELVEEMRAQDTGIELDCFAGWRCEFTDCIWGHAVGEADTAPTAICRAYLKAKEIQCISGS